MKPSIAAFLLLAGATLARAAEPPKPAAPAAPAPAAAPAAAPAPAAPAAAAEPAAAAAAPTAAAPVAAARAAEPTEPKPGEAAALPKDLLEQERAAVRAQKRELLARNLPLTPDEAAVFWPLYKKYEAEYASVNDEKIALARKPAGAASKADPQAWLRASLQRDQQLAKLRLDYLPQFDKVLSQDKVARLYRIDRILGILSDAKLEVMMSVAAPSLASAPAPAAQAAPPAPPAVPPAAAAPAAVAAPAPAAPAPAAAAGAAAAPAAAATPAPKK